MSKRSVAEQALIVAKRRERKRLKPIKKQMIEIIQARFASLEKSLVSWDEHYYDDNAEFYLDDLVTTSMPTIRKILHELGFKIVDEYPKRVVVKIPALTEENKGTVAQRMRNKSNAKIYEEQKNQADAFCQQVFVKIRNCDFYSYYDGCIPKFRVKVEYPKVKKTKGFEKCVRNIILKNAFSSIDFWYISNQILLTIEGPKLTMLTNSIENIELNKKYY